MRRLHALVPLAVAGLLVAGCSPQESTPTEGSAATPPPTASASASSSCSPETLQTRTAGTLTLATDEPVYEPWFVDNDPASGKGFEGAVAAALAEQLGYDESEVTWVRVPFNAAIQPGPKTFDVDINEFSITDARKKAVDFSAPYYDVTQAVIALESNAAAKVKDVAGLKDLKLGAQVGTTSLTAISDVIQPAGEPAVFNNNDDAKKALENGQIDALVLDLPTAFFVTAAEIDGSTIVGQLPAGGGTPEQFGMVLDKGSPLTECVSEAVEALRADGTLAEIEQEWLSADAGAPVLQ